MMSHRDCHLEDNLELGVNQVERRLASVEVEQYKIMYGLRLAPMAGCDLQGDARMKMMNFLPLGRLNMEFKICDVANHKVM